MALNKVKLGMRADIIVWSSLQRRKIFVFDEIMKKRIVLRCISKVRFLLLGCSALPILFLFLMIYEH